MRPTISTANDILATSRIIFSLYKRLSANFGSIWSWNILVFFFRIIHTKYIQTAIRAPAVNISISIATAITNTTIIPINNFFFSIPP